MVTGTGRGWREVIPVSGYCSVSGDNTLIAAPAQGTARIVVKRFVIENESATATTMILKDGNGNEAFRRLGQNQGDGLAAEFDTGHEWRLDPGTALILNLDGANQCGYSIGYWLEQAQ
jgi:hypothetical protein